MALTPRTPQTTRLGPETEEISPIRQLPAAEVEDKLEDQAPGTGQDLSVEVATTPQHRTDLAGQLTPDKPSTTGEIKEVRIRIIIIIDHNLALDTIQVLTLKHPVKAPIMGQVLVLQPQPRLLLEAEEVLRTRILPRLSAAGIESLNPLRRRAPAKKIRVKTI